jgi:asparagine synthase (glutamine-hydrolysing)
MLDEDIVDLGLTLPHRLKTNGRSGKLVLRRLAQRWLPAEVARHPKHGFSIPLDVMAPPAFHAVLEELLCSGDSRTGQFINRQLVRGWLTAFAAAGPGKGGAISRSGLYQRIMMLLSLELWLRRYGLSW